MTRPPDDIDTRLLEALRANARMSHAALGELVRLSRNAVRQRIEHLERDGHIRGYTIVEQPPGPEPVVAVLLIHRADRMRGADVITANRGHPRLPVR